MHLGRMSCSFWIKWCNQFCCSMFGYCDMLDGWRRHSIMLWKISSGSAYDTGFFPPQRSRMLLSWAGTHGSLYQLKYVHWRDDTISYSPVNQGNLYHCSYSTAITITSAQRYLVLTLSLLLSSHVLIVWVPAPLWHDWECLYTGWSFSLWGEKGLIHCVGVFVWVWVSEWVSEWVRERVGGWVGEWVSEWVS